MGSEHTCLSTISSELHPGAELLLVETVCIIFRLSLAISFLCPVIPLGFVMGWGTDFVHAKMPNADRSGNQDSLVCSNLFYLNNFQCSLHSLTGLLSIFSRIIILTIITFMEGVSGSLIMNNHHQKVFP